MEGKDSAEGGSATVGDLRKVYVATDEIVVLKYLSSQGFDFQQTVPNVFSSIPNRVASTVLSCGFRQTGVTTMQNTSREHQLWMARRALRTSPERARAMGMTHEEAAAILNDERRRRRARVE